METRGRVMGFVQMAFAASQILGIPVSLLLANKLGWHAPFIMIVLFSMVVLLIIFFRLKPVDKHLELKSEKNPYKHLLSTITNKKYIIAFGYQ